MRKTAWVLGLVVLGTLAWGQDVTPKPGKDGVYPMVMGMTPAKLVHGAAPEYPSDPSLAAERHVVALRVVIRADGTPGAIEIVNAHASPFDGTAIAAVKASQFTPASYEEKPVPTRMMVWVPFVGDKNLAVPFSALGKPKGFSVPMALNTVLAEFPEQARKEKKQGVVMLRTLVTEEGFPSDIHVVTPLGSGFDEKALKAVGKYKFRAAELDGIPVPMDITVEVNFRLY